MASFLFFFLIGESLLLILILSNLFMLVGLFHTNFVGECGSRRRRTTTENKVYTMFVLQSKHFKIHTQSTQLAVHTVSIGHQHQCIFQIGISNALCVYFRNTMYVIHYVPYTHTHTHIMNHTRLCEHKIRVHSVYMSI